MGEARTSEGVGGGGGGVRGFGGVKEVGLERNEDESRRTSHPILSAMRNVAHPVNGHQDVAAQRSERQSSCNYLFLACRVVTGDLVTLCVVTEC